MENQNRFDLEQAIRAYVQDCASRPGISSEDARELESDLRERVTEGIRGGLVAREAFSRAVGEIGTPGDLAREFERENPLAVWRERLFWMVWAGFVVSVWGFLTNGALVWFKNEFLRSVPFGAWIAVTGQLPVLIVAVVMARGRLAKRLPFVEWLFGSQLRLASVGGVSLVISALVRLFGLLPVQMSAAEWFLGALYLLDLFSWPFLMLLVGLLLFRRGSADKAAISVWRERVFWMAAGGLLAGFWQSASLCGLKALLYTGNDAHPFEAALLVVIGVHKLFLFSPVVIAGLWYRRRLQTGRRFNSDMPDRITSLVALAAVIAGWVSLQVWSNYLWMPSGRAPSWHDFWVSYVTNLRWFWPISLAALVLWLAPQGRKGGRQQPGLV